MGKLFETPIIKNFFLVNGKPTKLVGDPSHLIKAFDNYFLNTIDDENRGVNRVITFGENFQKQWNLETNVVSKNAVIALIEFQENQESPLVPKLNKQVLERATSRYGKMDVKPALIVFSKETAAGIMTLVNYHNYPKEYLATAQFIYQVEENILQEILIK